MHKAKYSHEDEIEAFTNLYKSEYEGLIRYACALLKGRSNSMPIIGRAEEVVQEMFVFAWDKREDLFSSEKPVGWLYNTLHYKVLELLRAENKWTKRLLLLESQHSNACESHIELEVEFKGIITRDEFNLLKRIYIEGYSYKELCEELHMKKSALGMKIKRIKEKIQKNFDL